MMSLPPLNLSLTPEWGSHSEHVMSCHVMTASLLHLKFEHWLITGTCATTVRSCGTQTTFIMRMQRWHENPNMLRD
jgi:hypothetical protein